MDGSAIFGQAEAADKDAKTDPKPLDSAQRPGTPAAANDDADTLLGADLLGSGQIRDEFQNERGIRVHMDRSRDANLTEFGKATLTDRYLMPGESFQDLFARVAAHYAADSDQAQRLYDYIPRLWFMPATPVLSNGGTSRGLPLSSIGRASCRERGCLYVLI